MENDNWKAVMNDMEAEKKRKLYEKFGLDPTTATESDLQGSIMQSLSGRIGLNVESLSAMELDIARLELRKLVKKVSE